MGYHQEVGTLHTHKLWVMLMIVPAASVAHPLSVSGFSLSLWKPLIVACMSGREPLPFHQRHQCMWEERQVGHCAFSAQHHEASPGTWAPKSAGDRAGRMCRDMPRACCWGTANRSDLQCGHECLWQRGSIICHLPYLALHSAAIRLQAPSSLRKNIPLLPVTVSDNTLLGPGSLITRRIAYEASKSEWIVSDYDWLKEGFWFGSDSLTSGGCGFASGDAKWGSVPWFHQLPGKANLAYGNSRVLPVGGGPCSWVDRFSFPLIFPFDPKRNTMFMC